MHKKANLDIEAYQNSFFFFDIYIIYVWHISKYYKIIIVTILKIKNGGGKKINENNYKLMKATDHVSKLKRELETTDLNILQI